MKVAVTGASGFIGRHVLEALIRRGLRPIAITRNPQRMGSFGTTVEVLEMDITQPQPSDFSKMGHPELLIHLAWEGLPHYQSLQHFEIELGVQYRFLKTMIQAGLPSLLVTGTCMDTPCSVSMVGAVCKIKCEHAFNAPRDLVQIDADKKSLTVTDEGGTTEVCTKN